MNKIISQSAIVTQLEHPHPVHKMGIFCPECGANIYGFAIKTQYICSHCRWHVAESDNFCWQCGGALEGFGSTIYWCINNELDKEAFTNLVEALKLSKEDVK